MTKQQLHVTIRTPRETVVDQDVASLRVPTQSGQVGLRPRGEPSVLAVEAGLIVLRLAGRLQISRAALTPVVYEAFGAERRVAAEALLTRLFRPRAGE